MDSVLWGPEGLDHAEGATVYYVIASGNGLFGGYGREGPGVCLVDGQTEAYLKDMGVKGLASAW